MCFLEPQLWERYSEYGKIQSPRNFLMSEFFVGPIPFIYYSKTAYTQILFTLFHTSKIMPLPDSLNNCCNMKYIHDQYEICG